ncbi:hydrolase, NUDIX family protein [Besnoitia besnoiti]|uniref:Hydrolase, NUDIX family protein n=1 Tax=Besnoitia besnoiti TaxID=94643 RepID=A0A2A9M788_BESBE|nr:hydrolase, NUDIX family protein [Besnoitia besnoiti]PFH31270.1 hydrolase, NUDIX family protein [Besnoitia besnoiti]
MKPELSGQMEVEGLPGRTQACSMELSRRHCSASKSRHVRREEMHCGDWLKLEKVTYIDSTGSRELIWERFVRTTPAHNSHRTQVPTLASSAGALNRCNDGTNKTNEVSPSEARSASGATSHGRTEHDLEGSNNRTQTDAVKSDRDFTSQISGEPKASGLANGRSEPKERSSVASREDSPVLVNGVPGFQAQADSVAVIAITTGRGRVLKDDDTGIILVRQYRPAVDAITVELPGGLVDKGEDLETAALRELKEETGFVGKVVSVGPKVTQSTLGREELHLVTISVDLDSPDNAAPRQQLDSEEDIEVTIIPLQTLWQELNSFSQEGYTIFDSLYSFAYGMQLHAQGCTSKAFVLEPSVGPDGK